MIAAFPTSVDRVLPTPRDPLSRFDSIDALRGFAFLGVLTVHAGNWTHFEAFGLVMAGRYGVQLFFLLSALTLARSLAVRGQSDAYPLVSFYLRRLFRVAPLFWFGIVFYLLWHGTGPRVDAPAGLHPWHFVVTALFVHVWFPTAINSVVPGGWSVGVEMTFYLMLPVFVRRVRDVRTAAIWIAGALLLNAAMSLPMEALLTGGTSGQWTYVGQMYVRFWFPSQVVVFLLGLACYHLSERPEVMAALRRPRASRGLLSLGMLSFVTLTLANGAVMLWKPFAVSLSLAAIVLAVLAASPRWLVNPGIRLLGRLSFSGYLMHFFALELVESLLVRSRLSGSPASHFAVLWSSGLMLTLVTSAVTYRWIEQPGIALGAILVRRLNSRVDSAPDRSQVVRPVATPQRAAA